MTRFQWLQKTTGSIYSKQNWWSKKTKHFSWTISDFGRSERWRSRVDCRTDPKTSSASWHRRSTVEVFDQDLRNWKTFGAKFESVVESFFGPLCRWRAFRSNFSSGIGKKSLFKSSCLSNVLLFWNFKIYDENTF